MEMRRRRTWTMPKKELDQPYLAARGTTATDITTRSALQSSITTAIIATTFALSGIATALLLLATSLPPIPSIPALHITAPPLPRFLLLVVVIVSVPHLSSSTIALNRPTRSLLLILLPLLLLLIPIGSSLPLTDGLIAVDLTPNGEIWSLDRL